MKKFLGLLFVAAMAGVLISGRGGSRSDEVPSAAETTPSQERPAAQGPSGSPVPPNGAAEARPEPGTEPPRPHPDAPPAAAAVRMLSSVSATRHAAQAAAGKAPAASERPAEPAAMKRHARANAEDAAASPAGSEPEVSIEGIQSLIRQGRRVEARKALTKIYLNATGSTRSAVGKMLDRINRDLVFNPSCLEGATVHVVKKGEVLARIARKYKVNWRMIARINAIERPERLQENQQLKILTGKVSILVDKSDFSLTLLLGGDYIRSYPVGIGMDEKTPAGTYVVGKCLVKPDWYPPGGGIIRYGEKGHLLGERWLGFKDRPGATGLGIHGTDEPETIGTKCSNGCIRMLNADVCELYDFVTPGATVTIVE